MVIISDGEKIMRITKLLILLFLLATSDMAHANQNTAADLLLTGNDIDLLVGAPLGITEPLDQRRTRHAAGSGPDFSGLLEDDLNSDVSFAELDWSDAEDIQVNEDQAEAQLLDLISETEELEKSDNTVADDLPDTSDAISSDNIETDLKL